MKTLMADSKGMVHIKPTQGGVVRRWQRWAPYAAVAWSLIYAALGIFWAVGGRGFPYTPDTSSAGMGPLVGRFGPAFAWVAVIIVGIPAAALGAAMLRGENGKPFNDPAGREGNGKPFNNLAERGGRSRLLRPLFITTGSLLAGVLLLLMTSLDLLVLFGYLPYAIRSLFTGAKIGQAILGGWTQWTTLHQLLCLIGGFLWLAATVTYARRSGNACLYCARRDGPEGWQAPDRAARWGRIAVWVAMVVPLFYAFTRYAWALGLPLGMSEAYLRQGQESGMWISGLFLATFGLVGGVLMLGLVQRWGEVFPRWMIGLSGRRVPVALAVIPAALVSVLLIVGGIGIWSALGQMVAVLAAGGAEGFSLFEEIFFQVGATLLFPVWGVALAVATLGYYYRRRGPCSVCGRGISSEIGKPSS